MEIFDRTGKCGAAKISIFLICLGLCHQVFSEPSYTAAEGMRFSISAQDIGGETFDRPPKSVTLVSAGKALKCPVLTQKSSYPITPIQCGVPNLAPGTYSLMLETDDGTEKTVTASFTVKPPEIYLVNPSEIKTGTVITVEGKYFGSKPKFKIAKADGGKVQCKLQPPKLYPSLRGKPGAGVMDPDTGVSKAYLLVKGDVEEGQEASMTVAGRMASGGTGFNFPRKAWTFLVYADADNNLEKDILNEFILSASAGSGDDINIVFQLDRAEGTDAGYGNWEITHRFFVQKGMEPTEDKAISDWGDGRGGGREVDMTDPDSLVSFINWGSAKYPAENYVLVVADHGYGWKGLCIDNTSNSCHMTVRDFSEALGKAAQKMDIILFDACLMQAAEVAYEIRGCGATYAVGSQATATPVLPFDKIFANLAENPGMSLLDFSKSVNDYYAEKNSKGTYYTHSTVELSKLESVMGAHRDFTASIVGEEDYSVQKEKAGALAEAIAGAVVYSRSGGQTADHQGLGIYFPESVPLTPPRQPGELALYIRWIVKYATLTDWQTFLNSYTSSGIPPFPIDNRIRNARDEVENVYSEEFVDFKTFCDKVAASE